jgi:hypothetical protein
MRVTVLRTFSTSCPPLYEPLRGLGHEVQPIVYDLMNVYNIGDRNEHRRQLHAAGCEVLDDAVQFEGLPARVNAYAPDLVVMIGCCDAGGAQMPNTDVLRAIGQQHPFVHICCDGSETDWWPQLARYHEAGCFALQINIDGVRIGPVGEYGLTTLCPIDPAGFPNPPRPWAERPVRLGFRGSYQIDDPAPGGYLHPRTPAIRELLAAGLLTISERDHHDPAQTAYRDFLSSCRYVWNHAATGSGQRMHVKARVIETALAGAVLVETAGSPTADWFEPGEDYLTYPADDVSWGVRSLLDNGAYDKGVAANLRRKVLEQHTPAAFWAKIVNALSQRLTLTHAEPAGHA